VTTETHHVAVTSRHVLLSVLLSACVAIAVASVFEILRERRERVRFPKPVAPGLDVV
jgi:hypothetical protein